VTPTPGASTYTLTVTGTTSESPLVTAVGFTYTVAFGLAPSPSIALAETEVFSLTTANRGTVVFAGANPIAAVEAAILNFLSGLVIQRVFPSLRTALQNALNAGVLTSMAGMIAPGTTTMPPGIIASVRTVSIGAGTGIITTRAGIGAFGGVFSKLPPRPSGGGSGTCVLSVLAALVVPALNLNVFRVARDRALATEQGAASELVAMYYRHGAEVARLFLLHPSLGRAAAALLPELQARLTSGAPIPLSFRLRCETLVHDLAARGSAGLRADVSRALTLEPWSVALQS
jgi:hypothetical protein